MKTTRHSVRRFGAALVALTVVAGLTTACYPEGTVIHGAVASAEGVPISAATVAVYASTSATTPTAQTETNLGGDFAFRQSDLVDGTYALKIAGAWWTGHDLSTEPGDAMLLRVDAQATPVAIDVTMEVTTAIVGTVVDRQGEAVGAQYVLLEDTGGHVVAFTTTQADGTFRLPVGTAGTYAIALIDAAGGRVVTTGGRTPDEFPVADGQTLDVGSLTITTALATAAGLHHSCALHTDGTVSCWGANDYGQLGDGTTDDSDVPVPVSGIHDATGIVAGLHHSCALHATGGVSCWGDGAALGNGTTADSSTPVPVSGITDATTIAASNGAHTCALLAGGTVACWGNGSYGQLGNGTYGSAHVPTMVSGMDDAVAVAAGNVMSCAVHAAGDVSCWGDNTFGELGNGLGSGSKVPVAVSGIDDATEVVTGGGHVCALRGTGAVSCWGYNSHGQVGDGTTDDQPLPKPVTTLGGVDAIAAGYSFTCARLSHDHTIACWGANDEGQIGDDTRPQEHHVPVAVPGLDHVVSVAGGQYHACAVLMDGTMECWGDDYYGALGAALPDHALSSPVPAPVVGIPVKHVAAS